MNHPRRLWLAWHARKYLALAGWTGFAGLLVMLALAWFWISQSSSKANDIAAPVSAVASRDKLAVPQSADQLAAFYGRFPQDDARIELVDRLFQAAASHDISLEQGDYRLLHEPNERMTRYELVLPVKGSYSQIRKFVAQVLQDVPTMALDSISLGRQKSSDSLVDAELRFTLYMVKA
jgi:hypothetical protein